MKVRPILRPPAEGTHVTFAQARAAFLRLKQEQEAADREKKKGHTRRKSATKAR